VPEQRWQIRYPIEALNTSQSATGTLYLGEDRFASEDEPLGMRLHYAITYDQRVDASGRLASDSTLWMGATYLGRAFPRLQIPGREWLSREPIPELPHPELEEDFGDQALD
jgi:hypothetical protein